MSGTELVQAVETATARYIASLDVLKALTDTALSQLSARD